MKKQIIKIPKLKHRVVWKFNPVTKIIASKKVYNRNKHKTLNY